MTKPYQITAGVWGDVVKGLGSDSIGVLYHTRSAYSWLAVC